MKSGWKRFIVGIVSPMLLALALFSGAVFGLILPALEQSTIERKREMIRELTASAWGILDECEQQSRDGKLTAEAARQLAVDQIRRLRYGAGGREYFWITDLSPRMVMHPYRSDLEGQSLADFRDPDGTFPFVNFARIARTQGEGYTAYRWQVYDETGHIAPKLSYVKLFAPWGWIIGTGLYVDDVRMESRRQTARLAGLGLGIFFLAATMLLLLARQSFRIERDRQSAEQSLRESEQRYRLLVESAGEGMMITSEGRVVFMNRPLRALLQLPGNEVPAGSAAEVFGSTFPQGPSNGPLTTRIRNSKGESILVSVSVSHLPEAGNDLLYVIRDLRSESTPVGAGRSPQDLSCLDEPELVEAIERAGSPLEIKSARNRLAGVITRGHAQGLHGSLLTRQITDVSDAAIRNCCERALKELGPAPVRFAFLAFGSEGRREASLITDQDNGLIYADPEPDQADGVSAYFELFSNKVCEALMEAGFVKCHGDLMASNPEWRMPSAQWCAAMGKWSAAGTPEALKGINVMADHRCTFGDETLCGDLRKALQAAARGSQVFYFNLAKAALVYRPPSEAFARWSPGGGTATLNIKEAITPIVNLARIYALRNGLSVISTPARLEALAGQGGLPAHEVPSLIGGFEFLLRLRLQRHLEIAAGDEKVDDLIQLARLSELDHATLRHVLELTDRMQNHLRMDFCAMQV